MFVFFVKQQRYRMNTNADQTSFVTCLQIAPAPIEVGIDWRTETWLALHSGTQEQLKDTKRWFVPAFSYWWNLLESRAFALEFITTTTTYAVKMVSLSLPVQSRCPCCVLPASIGKLLWANQS